MAGSFVTHGLPESFLEDLGGDIADLRNAIKHRDHAREKRVSSKIGIDEALDDAFGAVHKLDAIVLNAFRADPVSAAAWETARHIERQPRYAKADAAPPVPAPVTVPGVDSPSKAA